jgi:hypothetical protein
MSSATGPTWKVAAQAYGVHFSCFLAATLYCVGISLIGSWALPRLPVGLYRQRNVVTDALAELTC